MHSRKLFATTEKQKSSPSRPWIGCSNQLSQAGRQAYHCQPHLICNMSPLSQHGWDWLLFTEECLCSTAEEWGEHLIWCETELINWFLRWCKQLVLSGQRGLIKHRTQRNDILRSKWQTMSLNHQIHVSFCLRAPFLCREVCENQE